MEYRDSSEVSAVLQKFKLIGAVKDGNAEKVREICVSLPINFDINNVFEKSFYGTGNGTPLLHLACSAGNSGDVLKILVEYGGSLWSNKLDGLNLLHYACKRGILETIQFILGKCQDVHFLHSLSEDGYDALFYATKSCMSDPEEGKKVIELLLSQGKFSINRFRKDGSTEVLNAVVEGRCNLSSMLCELGADVNLGYHSSKKAIHWASEQSGYHDMIQLLIDHGANKNEVWRHCQRPIHLALKHGLTRNADVLLRSGVDISGSVSLSNPKYLWISTFCLAALRCPSLIPEFLARGANPQEMNYTSGYSVIGFAIENGVSREVIKSLLEAGADFLQGCHGKSAIKCCKTLDQLLAFVDCGIPIETIESQLRTLLLGMAISDSSEETAEENVKYLISKGASLKDPANGKDSILIASLKRRFYRVTDFLIEQGVNLNHRDEDWSTALHVICNQKSSKHEPILHIVSKLLAAGSLVNAKNVSGITPLLAALNVDPWHRRNDVIKSLLDNGAYVNIWFPKENKSTLCHTIEMGEIETTKLLVEAGYDVNIEEADGELPIFRCFPLDTSIKRELFRILLEAGTNPNAEDSKRVCLLERVFELLFLDMKYCNFSSFYTGTEVLLKTATTFDEMKEIFSLLLKKNANPNTAMEGEDSLLMKAIRYEREDIVFLLVKAGANISHVGESGNTAMDLCCCLHEDSTMKMLTNKGFKMSEVGLKIMDILIENGMPLDVPSFEGKYPLELLMNFKNTDVQIEQMLSRGADPNKYDKRGESLLIRSVYKSPSITLALLKAGAEATVKATDGRCVYDLFTERAFYDDELSCLDMEFALEIQMRTQTSNKEPILQIANISGRHLKEIKSFLDQFEPKPVTTESERSLIIRFHNRFSCWKTMRLIECIPQDYDGNNLQVNGGQSVWLTIKEKLEDGRLVAEEDGVSKVQQALDSCNVIETLIEADAIDVNSQTTNGLYPHCVAVKLGSLSLLKFLLAKKANPNIMDNMNETPLSLALVHGDVNMTRVLLEAKANVNHKGALPGKKMGHKESILSRLLDEKGSLAPCDKRILLLQVLVQNGASVNIDEEGVDSPLIKAVKLSSFKLVTELLKDNSQINHKGEDMLTALHVCCEQGIDQEELENTDVEDSNFSICKLLLTVGASANVQSRSGETPVHIAIRRSQGRFVLEMLNHNFEVNIKDNEGTTCLMLATKCGEEKVIKALLKFGADLTLGDKDGNTAFHYMCSQGPNLNLLDLFIESGADLNAVNNEGYSPLNTLVTKRDILHTDDVSALISKGADPNCCSKGCEPPLTNALIRLKFDAAKLLVKAGGDVNYVSKSGNTAIFAALAIYGDEDSTYSRWPAYAGDEACLTRREEIVECLLEAGADTNYLLEDISPLSFLLSEPLERDTIAILSNLLQHQADPNIGLENPLCLAAKYSLDTVKLLLEAGVDVNRKGSDGNTALINCLASYVDDKVEILRVLVEGGADTNIASYSGEYPIEIALKSAILHGDEISVRGVNFVQLRSEFEEMVNLLLDNGARCNANEAGIDSPLHIAVSANIRSVLKLLLDKGADVNHKGEGQQTPLHRYFKTGGESKKIRCLYTYQTYPYLNTKEETVLDVLLSNDAAVNEEDENGFTPLSFALETNAEDFRKLLVAGADPSKGGENIFEKCFALDDLSFLNTLLEVKGSSCVCDSLFLTFWSRQNDDVLRQNKQWTANVMTQILASPQEINVNTKNCSGNTPLVYFCGQNEAVVVETLLERGVDVNTICNVGRTALHALYYSSDSDFNRKNQILSSLMKKKPDVHIKDDTAKTVFEKAQEEYIRHFYYNPSRYAFLSKLIKAILLAGGECEKRPLSLLLQSASQQQHFSLMTTLVHRGADLAIEKRLLHLCFSCNYYYRESGKTSQKECLDFLLMYVKHGGPLNELDNQGNTPLMLYLKSVFCEYLNQEELEDSRDEIVSVLANDKYTVTRCNNTGLSPIHLASQKGRLSTMKLLESKGANLCDKDDDENTCLHFYLSKGSREALKETVAFCLEKGVSVNQINRMGETPLFLLIKNGHTSSEFVTTVRFLLGSGADPNLQLKHNNPLVAAIRLNCVNVEAILLEYGTKVNEIEDGPTALHVLFKNMKDHFEILIQMNSEKGANMSNHDTDRKTEINKEENSLGVVNQTFQTEDIVQKMLDCGADINALDVNGHTPLSILCGRKYVDPAERARIGIYLMSKGADPNIDCALHQAIENISNCSSNAEWSKFILDMIEMGANINVYKDEKPIILSATNSGCSDIVKALLDKSADIHATDSYGNTCLHLACDLRLDTERNVIASLLLQHGCSINRSSRYGKFPLSNLIKRITEGVDSTKIVQTETTTYAEVDLTLFNLLICGGSELDAKMKTSSYGESILVSLTRHGYFKAAGTLVKCGYDFKNDVDFKNCNLEHPEILLLPTGNRWYKRIGYENEKKEFLELLKRFEERVDSSLSSLCRDVIRKRLIHVGKGAEIESKIMLLPLPRKIKTYLSFREDIEEVEKIQIEKEKSSSEEFENSDYSDEDYGYDGMYYSDFWGYDHSDYDYYGDIYDSDLDSYEEAFY